MKDSQDTSKRVMARLDKKLATVVNKIRILSYLRTLSFLCVFVAPVSASYLFNHYVLLYSSLFTIFFIVSFAIFVIATIQFQKHKVIVENLIAHHQGTLLRINDKWQQTHTRSKKDGNHPYANDLSVTGQFSLFHFMDRCQTKQGQMALQNLLLNQPDNDALDVLKWQSRQQAIEELSKKKVMRMRWIRASTRLSNDSNSSEFDWPSLIKDMQFTGLLKINKWVLITLGLLSATTIITYPLSQMEFLPAYYLLSLPLQIVVFFYYTWRIGPTSSLMGRLSIDLSHLHKHFQEITNIKLKSQYWETFSLFQKAPTIAISQLTRLGGLFMLRKNPLVYGFFGILFFYEISLLYVLQKWLSRHKNDLAKWMQEIGTLDALISVATIVDTNPNTCFPVMLHKSTKPTIKSTNCRHPLLPLKKSFGNDMEIQPSTWILTGSNMSGKSTFLRTTGLNYLLALCGASVFADSYQFYPGGIVTSMQHVDSLQDSYSLFYTEVKKLKQIQDFIETNQGLVLIDEMLRGTNSRERQIAQEGFLKHIEDSPSLIIVATHDLQLAKTKNKKRICKHFRESIVNEEMTFDYKLHDGIVETSNALKIIKLEGIKL